MGFHIIEQFVESKIDGRACEDMIVGTNDFVAVIDGATDATGAHFAGKTGGVFAAEVLAATIETLPTACDARTFADTLSAALAAAVTAAVGELGDDTRWPVAVVICTSLHRREVWRIGDGNVVIDGAQHQGSLRSNDATHAFRAAVNAALLQKGTPLDEVLKNDPGAKSARALIDIQQHLANTLDPWGFGCINGSTVPDEYIEIMPIPAGQREIIVTSDGFPVVLATLAETEAKLREMIANDPAAIAELSLIGKTMKPGANAPDDRAYLRFTIN